MFSRMQMDSDCPSHPTSLASSPPASSPSPHPPPPHGEGACQCQNFLCAWPDATVGQLSGQYWEGKDATSRAMPSIYCIHRATHIWSCEPYATPYSHTCVACLHDAWKYARPNVRLLRAVAANCLLLPFSYTMWILLFKATQKRGGERTFSQKYGNEPSA